MTTIHQNCSFWSILPKLQKHPFYFQDGAFQYASTKAETIVTNKQTVKLLNIEVTSALKVLLMTKTYIQYLYTFEKHTQLTYNTPKDAEKEEKVVLRNLGDNGFTGPSSWLLILTTVTHMLCFNIYTLFFSVYQLGHIHLSGCLQKVVLKERRIETNEDVQNHHVCYSLRLYSIYNILHGQSKIYFLDLFTYWVNTSTILYSVN